MLLVGGSERETVRGARAWCACAALCLAAAALAAPPPDKRAEMAPAPFVMGSRYGRSPPRLMAPRNDRFFIGSRYGKRSDTSLPTAPQAPPSPAPALLCDYTGVYSLYRCHPFNNDLHEERTMEDSLSMEQD